MSNSALVFVTVADWFGSGYCAFTHKAGIHAKAILNNPGTYEILRPEDFGLTRYVSIGYVIFQEFVCFSGSEVS